MSNKPAILLVPEKMDIESEQVAAAWIRKGGRLRRLGKYWIKDEALVGEPLVIYGNQTFALVLEQIYGLQLTMPDDTLIARLGQQWIKREITQHTIGSLSNTGFPVFIKPVIPKLFAAGVFNNKEAFFQVTAGLQDSEEVLVASVVGNITAEARSFVYAGVTKDLALYEGGADLKEGAAFLADFIEHNKKLLPSTVVIDIAYAAGVGWFVLEFNACWGAGLNNCNAELVIDCIIAATSGQAL